MSFKKNVIHILILKTYNSPFFEFPRSHFSFLYLYQWFRLRRLGFLL